MNIKITKENTLISLHTLVGFSAVAGGLSLINNPRMMPVEWLDGTFFDNYFLPGVILFGVVGLSSVIAGLSMILKISGRYMASLMASLILIFWLTAEIAIIGEIHFLQILYYALGLLSVYLLKTSLKRDSY